MDSLESAEWTARTWRRRIISTTPTIDFGFGAVVSAEGDSVFDRLTRLEALSVFPLSVCHPAAVNDSPTLLSLVGMIEPPVKGVKLEDIGCAIAERVAKASEPPEAP